MLHRFQGDQGERLLSDAIAKSRIVEGDRKLAEALVSSATLVGFEPGSAMVVEGATDNDIYFIVAGNFEVSVKGNKVARRTAGEIIGETAAINPAQARTATLTATENAVALRISEGDFSRIADEYPGVWKRLAFDLSRRLNERNAAVSKVNEQPQIFVICSVEALEIAQEIQLGLSHEECLVTLWTNGVFIASNYPVESLEGALEAADFAVALAHPDDETVVRGESKRSPRDNVIFELGFFMGRLGRKRTILLEPRGEDVKLPSDLTGINTIRYRTGPPTQIAALLAPTCTELAKLFKDLGPR
jgi:CRP/FNR family cyclic AMP-dependent transcriptional regulator